MKNKKVKLIVTLGIAFSLIVSAIPFSINAAATSSDQRRVAPSTNLRAKLQARATSTRATTTKATTTKSLKVAKAIEEAIKKADTEITKRIESLEKTLEKISEMKNVSDSEKNSIKTEIQSEIDKLNTLKSKIDSDTDLATIKTDLNSITAGSRIYALVIPRANILASVDKINTIATMLETISVKLQARIDEVRASSTNASSTNSTNVVAMQTLLDGIKAKIADAKKEALTAQTTVTGLTPDNGNKTILDSNNAKIKSAKANIKTANKDLDEARKFARSIAKGLKSPKEKVDMGTLSGKNTKTKTTNTKSR